MAIQISDRVANAMLDSIEATIGASPILRIRSGAAPLTTAAADSGTVLATINLPSDWMANASGRSKQMSGTWNDNSTDAAGTAGHYRIYTSGGVCEFQGSVTATGGGGDMTVDNTVFAAGQDFTITAFAINAPNNA